MADSDDTTTLPLLSRRDLLGGATVLPIGAADTWGRSASADPVLDAFREWRTLNGELDAWQDDCQKKLDVLLRAFGIPRVLVRAPTQPNLRLRAARDRRAGCIRLESTPPEMKEAAICWRPL